MQSVTMAAAVFVLALSLPVAAETRQPVSQTAAPAQEQAEAPVPVGVAGKWTMTIQTPRGANEVALDVKLDDEDKKTVSGTLEGPQGLTPIKGEYTDEDGLSFQISLESPGGPVSIPFTGKLQEDGSLAGTVQMGELGQLAWTAKRAK